jgi:hypothetical protein
VWQRETPAADFFSVMHGLTKLEYAAILLTAVWVGYRAYPGYALADMVGSLFVMLFAYLAMTVIVIWIKSGGDTHL